MTDFLFLSYVWASFKLMHLKFLKRLLMLYQSNIIKLHPLSIENSLYNINMYYRNTLIEIIDKNPVTRCKIFFSTKTKYFTRHNPLLSCIHSVMQLGHSMYRIFLRIVCGLSVKKIQKFKEIILMDNLLPGIIYRIFF